MSTVARRSTVAGLTAVGLALITTASASAEQPEHIDTTNIAHRGAMGYAPENTLAAFELGIQQGSDLIEADVQRSKDGVLVLMHDTTLARTTNVEEVFPDRAPWNVSDFTYAEMQQLDAGSWFSPEFAGERIPTMADMVEQVRKSHSGILMELKSPSLYPGIEQDVADEFASFPGYVNSAVRNERLVVQSFDWDSMASYHAAQPTVPVGLLGTVDEADLAQVGTWADQVNPSYTSFDADYVDAVHAAGMEVHTYTVNAPESMNEVLDRGVDGVITNYPDVLESVLNDRRQD